MAEADGSRPKCQALRKDGRRCGSFALPGSPYCFAHDPDRRAEREAARRRGGQHSSKVHRLARRLPPRLVPVFDILEAALTEVHDGGLDPRRALAMASLARAMVTVMQAGVQWEERRAVDLAKPLMDVIEVVVDEEYVQQGELPSGGSPEEPASLLEGAAYRDARRRP